MWCYPFYPTPELQVWKTPLNDKLLITGTCGVNKELIEKHNNFPRFNVIHLESETEEELLTRIKTEITALIESLSKIDPKRINGNCATEKQTDSVTCSIQKSDNSVKRNRKKGEGPTLLTDGELSEDEDDEFSPNSQPDTETSCRSCLFNVEIPKQMEESNQIFINRESE